MLVPITIRLLTTESASPISNATVSVWDTYYSSCIESGVTDTDGRLVIGLDSDAEYRLFAQKDNYTFYPIPKSIAIAEHSEIFEFLGTESTITTIPEGLVWLYGQVKDLTLNPAINAAVFVSLTSTPQTKDAATLTRATLQVNTSADGKWGTLLSGGTRVSVAIPSCKFSKTGVLPFTGTIDVNDLGLYG